MPPREKRKREERKPDEETSSGWVIVLRLLSFSMIYFVFQFYYRFFHIEVQVSNLSYSNFKGCLLKGFSLKAEPCQNILSDVYSFINNFSHVMTSPDPKTKPAKRKFARKFRVSPEQKDKLIQEYFDEALEMRPDPNCAIGVGYNVCTDINFRAIDLIKHLEPEIMKMEEEEGELVEAKVHPEITNLREFIETFAYQFRNGANAERVTNSMELFNRFLALLEEKKIPHRKELGGHSPVWALRAQREGCKAFIAAQSTPVANAEMDYINKNLPEAEKKDNDLLIWPRDKTGSGTDESADIHFVFEYAEGDSILQGRFTAPRSNRFYFVNDPNGGYLKQLEPYHELVKEHTGIRRHMFGGYQLLQKLAPSEAEDRLKKEEELWKQMKAEQDHRIHVEFADFSNPAFFQLFEKYVVRNANSLGMNEQEMMMLLDYWESVQKGGGLGQLEDFLNSAKDSKPSFREIIVQLKQFFEAQKKMGLDISRVHLHPYGSFFVCYDKNKWMDGRQSIVKSSMAIPPYCMDPTKTTDLKQVLENFSIDNLPEHFDHPMESEEKIKVHQDTLTYDFQLTEEVDCYMQFFIKCKKVYKTAGMGDTISATGFIYHEPRFQN